MKPTTVAMTAARNMLKDDATISAAVGTKIFSESAPPQVSAPYILIRHLMGGDDNRSYARNFDIYFEIFAVTTNPASGQTLADKIDELLVQQYPTYPDDWNPYTWVTAVEEIYQAGLIESTTFFRIGGQYRFRGSKRL